MTTFVICHGAWSGGWSWKAVRARLAAAGHEVYAPSYTGLGERAHLASPLVGLATHIQDIVNLLWYEDLAEVVLLGHSYGGMVVTGVGDRLPDRIRHVIYLDAFVPADGESVRDLTGSAASGRVDGWLVPHPGGPVQGEPNWSAARHRGHPGGCFDEKIRLAGGIPPFRRSYIHCSEKSGHDVFRQFADRYRGDPAWTFHAMAASHSPNFTAPDALAELLLALA